MWNKVCKRFAIRTKFNFNKDRNHNKILWTLIMDTVNLHHMAFPADREANERVTKKWHFGCITLCHLHGSVNLLDYIMYYGPADWVYN